MSAAVSHTGPLTVRLGLAPRGYRLLLAALAGVVIAFAGVSLLVGQSNISIIGSLTSAAEGQRDLALLILGEIRLPRTLLGVFVGATLGMSGAALQGFLRNPLAEPGVIGISSSAALGAVIALYFGLSASFALALPIGGMTGALLAVVILYVLAGRDASILTLILAGIALTNLAGALTALALNLAPSPWATLEIVFWLLGSLADRSFEHFWLAAPPMAVGWVMLAMTGRALDAMSLGDETARTLGIDLRRARLLVIGGVALSVGAAVSVSGTIGFVGLVVPHLVRPLVGYQPSRLLFASAFAGAALVLAGDILIRLVSGTVELRLGVLTALIGAPFFLFLLMKTRRSMR